MTRRRSLHVASTLMALVVVWIICQEVKKSLRPNRDRFEQVQKGMSLDQVIDLVGGPPGDYRTDRHRFSISHHSLGRLNTKNWISDDGYLLVTFDDSDRVEYVKLRDVIDTGWFHQLRTRLGF
jgi:hypothetical protein